MVGICGTSCEDLPTYVSSSLAYHAHVTVDSDKSCVCHDKLVNKQFAVLPHDDESSHQLVHSLAIIVFTVLTSSAVQLRFSVTCYFRQAEP